MRSCECVSQFYNETLKIIKQPQFEDRRRRDDQGKRETAVTLCLCDRFGWVMEIGG